MGRDYDNKSSSSRGSTSSTKTKMNPKQMFVQEVLEKARKAELVQKQIQENLKKLNSSKKLLPVTSSSAIVRPLMVDNLGRVLDESGNLLKEKPVIQSSLKVNRNLEMERMKKQTSAPKTSEAPKVQEALQYIDPSLEVVKKRKRGQFRFIEPGTFIKQERQLQRQMEEKALGINKRALLEQKKRILEQQNQRLNAIFKMQVAQDQANNVDADAGADAAVADDNKDVSVPDLDDLNPNLIPLKSDACTLENKDSWDDDEPALEWWDRGILIYKNGDDPFKLANAKPHQYLTDVNVKKLVLNEKKFNLYIEHPCKIDGKRKKIAPLPVMLTKQERKRLRRRKRQEKLKKIQDKIRVGLLPPPPPKLKLSNLMNVLKDQSVADPSKIEMQVREQMEERLRNHEKRNEERKLTPEQRSRKHAKKWQVSKNGEIEGALFSIASLEDPKLLFRVDVNAQQLHLTGCCIVASHGPCLVVVEGSKVAIRRFVKLLMRRIKWNEFQPPDGKEMFCKEIWVGGLKRRSFTHWSVSFANCDEEIVQVLKPFKATHYFEMIQKYRDPLEDF